MKSHEFAGWSLIVTLAPCDNLGTMKVFHWQRHAEGRGSRFSSLLFALMSVISDVMLIAMIVGGFFSLLLNTAFKLKVFWFKCERHR